VEKPLHVNTIPSGPIKDPRLKDNSHHSIDKQPSKSPKGPKKGKAVSVVNKIMNNLSGKKVKSVKKSPLTSPTSLGNEPIATGKEPTRNWDGTLIKSKDASNSVSISTSTNIDPISTKTLTSSDTIIEKEPVKTKPSEETLRLSNPFTAFNGLSSRDMEIAAHAAAIATAMHQMKSSAVNGPMQPEQSAQFAAEFMKLMQGSAQGISTVTTSVNNTTSNTTTNSETSSKSSAAVTSADNVKKQKVRKSLQDIPKVLKDIDKTPDDGFNENLLKSASNVKSGEKIKPEKCANKKPKKDLLKVDTNKDSIKVDTKDMIQSEKKHPKHKIGSKNSKETKNLTQNQTKSSEKSKVGDKNKNRRQNDNDKLEPLSKKAKESPANNDSTERSRKSRARSPSRYYCQIEQKTESEKRVVEKGKELSLERKRKDSESEETQDGKAKDHLKLYKQFFGHIEALEKRCKEPNSTINVGTLESVFKQVS